MVTPTKITIPPIVGVPAFSWWPAGPSSRMYWPNSFWRSQSMNFGPRKMQIRREAIPPMRISPTRPAPARVRRSGSP